MKVDGMTAQTKLSELLSPTMLEALGGELPERWPESAAPLSIDLPIEIAIPINRAALGKVGEDLALFNDGQAEARLLRGEFLFTGGDLNLPLLRAELSVLTPAEGEQQEPVSQKVAYLEGLQEGQGEMLFLPGGRKLFTETVAKASSELSMQLLLHFDSRKQARLPAGAGLLELTLYVDILK